MEIDIDKEAAKLAKDYADQFSDIRDALWCQRQYDFLQGFNASVIFLQTLGFRRVPELDDSAVD